MSYCVFLGDSLISQKFKKKKKPIVPQSSAGTEYKSLASVVSEVSWLQTLLQHFEVELDSSMLFCDSQSAIYLAINPTFHERSKHMEIVCHFIQERVAQGLGHVKSQHQLVDLLTKPVSSSQFKNLMSKLGIINTYMST